MLPRQRGIKFVVLQALLALQLVQGDGDAYSNSFISPSSSLDKQMARQEGLTSQPPPELIPATQSRLILPDSNDVTPDHIHLSRTSAFDNLLYKNIAESLDSNDVEFSARTGHLIQPSKTDDPEQSGESRGVPPQARSLPLPGPPATTVNVTTAPGSDPAKPRQANPDIQDIITGIVKLLNGNVNVQANTAPAMGRPLRPLSTRINNRGPPRITDVPALPPDFDIPAAPPLVNQMPPSRVPTPYPFDVPPPGVSPARPYNNIPLNDPPTSPGKRPGFYRPVTIPPWNRRRPPMRRPPYKPLPPDLISLTSEKPPEDILTLDLGPQMEEEEKEPNVNLTTEAPQNETTLAPPTTLPPETTTMNTTTEVEEVTPPLLESSIQEVLQTLKDDLLVHTTLSSTPTESLPEIIATNHVTTIESTPTISTNHNNTSTQPPTQSPSAFNYYPYKPRPGIVLDDTEYKPGGSAPTRSPILTRPQQIGDIFDITVSAIQGPGSSDQGKPFVIPVDLENSNSPDVITSPVGSEGFVSIDGKRTYLNLFGEATPTSSSIIKPSAPTHNQVTGTGFAVVETDPKPNKPNVVGSVKPTQRRPVFGHNRPASRPSQPPVRIDTCIVGDDSTCDVSQHEICRTELGVSACHCRPGTARRKHRDPCRKIVSVLLSLRVDRLYERRVIWASELSDKTSDSYQQLSYEAERALESAMSMTPFSDEFLGSKVNNIYKGERAAGQAGVFVNLTLQLEENSDTARPTVRGDIQKHLLGVIQRRSNNVGNSALWVDSPPGSVSNLQDLDECSAPDLHDCHTLAKCINIFGGFKCECLEGFRDPWSDNKHRAGRQCEQCSPQHCNNRGECKYQNGQEVCVCTGNYYGAQCELDGEVLGVAIGASVAAVIIIGLTLVCLVMWSRRWSREQKAAVGSPVFGYMATASNTVKTPAIGGPPYQLTLEDRLRWAQIADVMTQANHYAPEPHNAPTRPSSALFGYPSLSMGGTLSMHGTLPPVPLPRLNLQAQLASRAASAHGMRPLDNSSSSEEEDKADLLGRNFQVPRPKSRSNASIANQSGIYYDVDYDQNEIYKQVGGIPMSTYSMGRPPYFRN